MTQEFDHGHQHTSSSIEGRDVDRDPHPGRASRSALMRKPDHAIVSGLLSRAARDANGVAPDAEAAVAAAGTSTGAPLPTTLMRKFESSLGADLGNVRVHTGEASAVANDAVGARAYTLGQDIHFGAGQYDPSSPAGEHLLAHEVAHTVQQAGGAQRMQFQLAVSSPGDAHEHEADRAASAMVAGSAATVSFGGGVAREVMREEKAAPVPAAALEGFAASITMKKFKLGPPATVGNFVVGCDATFTANYGLKRIEAEGKEGEKKEGGKPAGVTVGGKAGKDEGVGIGAAIEKEVGEGWGFHPTVEGEATIGSKESSIGVGVSVSHPLFLGMTAKAKLVKFDLAKWDGEEKSLDLLMFSTGFEIATPTVDFNFGGVAHRVGLTGGMTLSIQPSKVWLLAKIAELAASDALLMAGMVAAGLFTVIYGFIDAFSTGDTERISESFGNSCKDYARGAEAGCRDEEKAPPGTPSKWASISNVAGFLKGKMLLEEHAKSGKVPRSVLVAANKKRPIARDAWNAKWPAMKEKAIQTYIDSNPVEMAMSGGTGYGSGGLQTLRQILDAYGNPFAD